MIKDIRTIGNSKGILLPKEVIEFFNKLGTTKVKIEIKNNNVILRKPRKNEKL
jgi:antitoxin component of MazEF toxin-antitoxin module